MPGITLKRTHMPRKQTDYYEYRLTPDDPDAREALLGLCSPLPFESFLEEDGALLAWVPASVDPEALERALSELTALIPFAWSVRRIEARNWNELWESSFQPVVVRDFCGLRAPFHDPLPQVRHEIVIEPKMAFGTGHHETTWMMIDRMEALDFAGRQVLDYGCGTGVLAILAARLGAGKVAAVDIEEPAWESTLENAERNGVRDRIEVIHGTLEDVPAGPCDIILANINRNVILDSLADLYARLSANGILLLSGILAEDEVRMQAAARTHHFRPVFRNQRNQWLCLEWRKS